MATTKKQKAPMLAAATQRRIGIFKDKNPRVTYTELAKQFNCTYSQAVHAALQYKKGYLGKPRLRRKSIENIKQEYDALEILRRQVHTALAHLESEAKLAVSERMSLVAQAVGILKTLQTIEITGHIKRNDAAIIVQIIRRFKPDASEEDSIIIYREEYEKWKSSV